MAKLRKIEIVTTGTEREVGDALGEAMERAIEARKGEEPFEGHLTTGATATPRPTRAPAKVAPAPQRTLRTIFDPE